MAKRQVTHARRPSRSGEWRARPRTILALVVLIVAAALGGWWWTRVPVFTLRVNAARNILLVTIDTLRADSLGAYGGRALTPNLDRLAAAGARFTFAHAHAVVTLPSHASILTGRYPYEHGIRDNTGYRLRETEPTAATILGSQGFATGAFIGGFPLDSRFGLGVGFDIYDDRLKTPSRADASDRERRADLVVDSALAWIGRQSGKWFAWVHVYDPHDPYEAPADWAARFPSEPYLGEVSWTDVALGTLFDRLSSQPRPTLVIVTADHGESLGEHGELTHSIFAYEAVLRVPLIVSELDPGRRDAGRAGVTIETPVRHVDLLPTLLGAVGAPADAALPGESLRDLIAGTRGADGPSYFEAMTTSVTRGWAPLRGVLVGREKLIDLPLPELYDLSEDPGELRNIIDVRAARAHAMRDALRRFDVAPPARAQAETPETLERLRSLGYIGGAAVPIRESYTEADDPKRLIEIEQTMTRAAEAHRQGRPAEAIEMYKSVIVRRPDTEDAYRRLALVYWRIGRPHDAIATLEAALGNGITQSEVRIKLGQYMAEAGQAGRAVALLEQTAGDDPDALIALGNAYTLAGRPEDALRTYRRLLDVDPDNGLAYENIGVAELQRKDYAAAEAALRRALDLDSTLTGSYTALGVVLAETGRRTEAIDAWKRAVELDGTAFNALFNVTVNLAAAGRRDEARAYGERFIATAPPALRQDVATVQRLLGGGS
ncbi:MAG TPA: sulfatase-like hydrolase/transferase [Vicinamibacterales bacterium]|nr:sulfatase-like hydrolase/transferase [Vicinamibacterales bacterium]